MCFGYVGQVLEVDLSSGTINKLPLSSKLASDYIGGSGFGTRVLYNETGPSVDPLGSKNPIIFAVGPFSGTRVPTGDRWHVVAKSPLTSLFGESDCGGRWGRALKQAGYDMLIIRGAARTPCYLCIDDGVAKLVDATHVWGKDTFETDEIIRQETGPQTRVASIGPAGENLVWLACIITDGKDARAAGRCGLGAVMGSKKLKAIAVRGNRRPEVADEKQLKRLIADLSKRYVKNLDFAHQYGTAGSVPFSEAVGDLPIRNWVQRSWKNGADKISGVVFDSYGKKHFYCSSCPVGCGKAIKPYGADSIEIGAPEYESAAALGAMCLVDDFQSICKANELCNRYGLDTISTGATISFAMEAWERGDLEAAEFDAKGIYWGDGNALIKIIESIAYRRGDLGDLLAHGVRYVSSQLGGSSEEYAVHVKGLEVPMHDPRAYASLAVAYATSNRGACHVAAISHGLEAGRTMPEFGFVTPLDRFQEQGKGRMVAQMQDLMSLFDSLKLCKFMSLSGGTRLHEILELFTYVTGKELSINELMTIGERIFNLKRLYNVRHGINRQADMLPERLLRSEKNKIDINLMLDEYYDWRGWDSNGVPKPKTLSRLGLATEGQEVACNTAEEDF